MTRDGRRAGLALLLTVVGAGLLAWQLRPWRPVTVVVAPASEPQARPVPLGVVTPAAQSASAPGSSPGAGASLAAGPKAEGSKELIEVCGVGRVQRSELEQAQGQPAPAWAQSLEKQSEQGLADLLKRLDTGPVKQRVAAAVLRRDVQAAARLAASTDDGAAYRIALRACRQDAGYRELFAYRKAQPPASVASGFVAPELAAPGPVPDACAALNLERLAALDPGDAWPWLLRLSDARVRGDDAAVSQALYEVAQRRRLSASTRALSSVVAEVIPGEPSPGEAFALVAVVGTDMASTLDGSLWNVLRPCSVEALRDANRRQLCEQVARRMPDMVAEALDARALHSLEERLGLPHSAQAMSRADVDRAMKGMAEDSGRWMDEPSCASISRMGLHIVKLARGGELASMREWLKAAREAVPASSATP